MFGCFQLLSGVKYIAKLNDHNLNSAMFVMERISNDIAGAKLLTVFGATKLDLGQIQYEMVSGKIRRTESGIGTYLTYDKEIRTINFAQNGNKTVNIELVPFGEKPISLEVASRCLNEE